MWVFRLLISGPTEVGLRDGLLDLFPESFPLFYGADSRRFGQSQVCNSTSLRKGSQLKFYYGSVFIHGSVVAGGLLTPVFPILIHPHEVP